MENDGKCRISLTEDGYGVKIECPGVEVIARPGVAKTRTVPETGNTRAGADYLFHSEETAKERELMDKIFGMQPPPGMKEKMKKWFEGWTF